MSEHDENPVAGADGSNATHPAGKTGTTPAEKDNSAGATIRQSRAPREIGGPAGPEPTRYGDWEKNGICSDF